MKVCSRYFLVAGLLVVLKACSTWALLTASGRRPSIVLMVSDDLRFDRPFAWNGSAIKGMPKLPNIRRLMTTGITFENAMSNFASCSPSRQSFLTGRTADALGVWTRLDNFRQKGTAPRSLPEHLKDEGYHTVSIGKIFHIDEYYGIDETHSWSETYFGDSGKTDPRCPTGSYFCACQDAACADSKISAKAVTILPQLAQMHLSGTPFFLAVGFRRPHLDWRVPKDWAKKLPALSIPLKPEIASFPSQVPDIAYLSCDTINARGEVTKTKQSPLNRFKSLKPTLTQRMREGYWKAVAYMDVQVGKVLDAVRKNNLEQEAIVVFLSDHGYSLGERGFWCKQSLQDIALHIPLIISIPWLPSLAKKRSLDMVELIDVYPTITTLANAPKLDSCLQGRDLSPLIESDVPELVTLKEFSISTYPRCTNGDPSSLSTLSCNNLGADKIAVMGYSIRTRQFRYTQWRTWITWSQAADWSDPGLIGVELYDHRENRADLDPGEFENVNLAGHPDFRQVELTLKERLESFVTVSAYSNKRCTLVQPQTMPPAVQRPCQSATNEAACAAMFAYRCAWFYGYRCQESTFCGFLTNTEVKKSNTGKTPHGLPVGAPGCSLFSSRCAWKNGKCKIKQTTIDDE